MQFSLNFREYAGVNDQHMAKANRSFSRIETFSIGCNTAFTFIRRAIKNEARGPVAKIPFYRIENELTSLDLIQLHDNHKCPKGTIFRKHTQKNCGRSVIKGGGGIDMSAI